MLKEALSIYQHSLPSNHPSTKNVIEGIASVYQEHVTHHAQAGDYRAAFREATSSLQFLQGCLPPTHPTVQFAQSQASQLE